MTLKDVRTARPSKQQCSERFSEMSKQKVCHKPVALILKYEVLKKGQERLGKLEVIYS